MGSTPTAAEIYVELTLLAGEHVIKKRRYSAFAGDLLPCNEDAMSRNYRVVFLSGTTAIYNYPDRGVVSTQAAEVSWQHQQPTLRSVDEMKSRMLSASDVCRAREVSH